MLDDGKGLIEVHAQRLLRVDWFARQHAHGIPKTDEADGERSVLQDFFRTASLCAEREALVDAHPAGGIRETGERLEAVQQQPFRILQILVDLAIKCLPAALRRICHLHEVHRHAGDIPAAEAAGASVDVRCDARTAAHDTNRLRVERRIAFAVAIEIGIMRRAVTASARS